MKKVTGIKKRKSSEGNFLSKLMFVEQRKHERFEANLPCKIHYFKNGIRQRGNMEARLLNISAGGALIRPRFMLRRDIHLYLILDNYPFKITAAIVDITKRNVHHLKFAIDLPDDDVQPISVGAPYGAVLNWRGNRAS